LPHDLLVRRSRSLSACREEVLDEGFEKGWVDELKKEELSGRSAEIRTKRIGISPENSFDREFVETELCVVPPHISNKTSIASPSKSRRPTVMNSQMSSTCPSRSQMSSMKRQDALNNESGTCENLPTKEIYSSETRPSFFESQNYKILIVDDSGLNRRMLKRLLHVSGYDFDEAEDGLIALDKVTARMASVTEGHYDVILMDYVMPNMDGPTATKAIRDLGYTAPIFGKCIILLVHI
jgi:hypothetical protein